ncbi:MAG: hypothetical protein WD065_17100 [Planctomycetaceae bacterium]
MLTRQLGLAVVLASGVGLVFWTASVDAQKTKGKERPAATKYLMRGIMGPNCGGIGTLLKDAGPEDDKAWDTVACHAACLSELGHGLMDDGRCPDAVWAGATKSLREGSAAVLAAAEKKDLAAAQEAFKTVTGACATCHKAHKG